ncbi:hypothetical protein [Streptomyces sp. FIT100]|uniref:hypothetical protein n=1 Tax=Streptomyces sp. FIT100 TaxID=2837956 RepID=UPI0021C8E54C|nr:hypothetical protein [Streptomyces sp. FIT100]UUN28754.1 hypothetical protein KK483_21990 [Streptomyces sp. FIT100]
MIAGAVLDVAAAVFVILFVRKVTGMQHTRATVPVPMPPPVPAPPVSAPAGG